jgi:hypothetical protein
LIFAIGSQKVFGDNFHFQLIPAVSFCNLLPVFQPVFPLKGRFNSEQAVQAKPNGAPTAPASFNESNFITFAPSTAEQDCTKPAT